MKRDEKKLEVKGLAFWLLLLLWSGFWFLLGMVVA